MEGLFTDTPFYSKTRIQQVFKNAASDRPTIFKDKCS